MAARSRFHPDTTGKDHDRSETFSLRRSSTYTKLAGRWKTFRRRRIILALVAGWLLYLFFKHMPTDLPPESERYDRRYGRLRGGPPGLRGGEPPGLPQLPETYEGPIKYHELGRTIQPHMWSPSGRPHVLFAVSDMKSVPQVLPLACSMAQSNHTRVHLAFMGRGVAGWREVQEMNGFAAGECDIFTHDARPDHATQSSRSRLDVSAMASLGHIHSALRLQAVVIIDSDESSFLDTIRDKASISGIPLIDLPVGGLQSLSWLSSLDIVSFSYLNKIQIDIVIHAQIESSASLMRLLRSIKDADYAGWKFPRVTVELPSSVDPFLADYLSNFRWSSDSAGHENRLVVRHRLDSRVMSPVQASMRTVESFYPLGASTSHVLMLSPNVELSPNYFQFLMYTILEYRYGAAHKELGKLLMGISLDLPSIAPDQKTAAPYESHVDAPLVLWQAPTSNAGLYFGDRWAELHTFLSWRLLLDSALAQKTPSSPTLSHEYPAWLQPVLEMMQVQGYYMLYPTMMLKEGSSAITVHRELPQSPEEFMVENMNQESGEAKLDWSNGDTLTADQEIARLAKAEHRAFPASLVTPLVAFSEKGETDIPLLSFYGERRELANSASIAWKAAEEFATSVGGCKSFSVAEADVNVANIFCLAA